MNNGKIHQKRITQGAKIKLRLAVYPFKYVDGVFKETKT